MTDFGGRVRALREGAGLSQDDLADLLAAEGETVTGAAVSYWEAGTYKPRKRTVAEALDKVLDANGELLALLGLQASGPGPVERIAELEARMVRQEERLEVIEGLLQDALRTLRGPTAGPRGTPRRRG